MSKPKILVQLDSDLQASVFDGVVAVRPADADALTLRSLGIGVLGLGVLGSRVARFMHGMGFPVRGWSRGSRQIDGVECFAGEASLATFLSGTQMLVCLLPLTDATRDLLNRERLLQFGVAKVIWIFTGMRKIMVAEKGRPWLITDWDDTVEVVPGCAFSLRRLIEDDGVDVDVFFPKTL